MHKAFLKKVFKVMERNNLAVLTRSCQSKDVRLNSQVPILEFHRSICNIYQKYFSTWNYNIPNVSVTQ